MLFRHYLMFFFIISNQGENIFAVPNELIFFIDNNLKSKYIIAYNYLDDRYFMFYSDFKN